MRRTPPPFRPGPFAYHQEVELRIETLTNQGHGLGRVSIGSPEETQPGLDRWVVMVPFALPDELVRARIFRNHKNFSEADLIEVIEQSPQRVVAPCPLFGQCGGCQYQNLAYSQQLVWKRQQVAELLRHTAGLDFPVNPVVASPREFGYRAKITPHFDKPRHGQVGPIGFLRVGCKHQLIDVPHCPIATEGINARLPALREQIRSKARDFKNGATLLLRETGDGSVVTDPNAVATSQVGPLIFEHLASDFFQTNPFILQAFVRYIVAEAARAGARFLVDAYCGSGLFALSAATHFEAVVGVEISPTAVERAERNAFLNKVKEAGFLAASAEAVFENVRFPGAESAVVIDPPRKGCSEEFLQQLVTWHPRRCVYVSCNPSTQMRDLRILHAAGYHLTAVQPFDLFPQTKHLECVISLRSTEPLT